MSATVIQFPTPRRLQRGHGDYRFIAWIFGGGAVALGLGLIALGLWLVWQGAGTLGWR